MYERLSRSLAEHNIEKVSEECCTKIEKKLCQVYKKIKDQRNLTDRGKTDWKYFSKLVEILAAWPATHPLVLVDTLELLTAHIFCS